MTKVKQKVVLNKHLSKTDSFELIMKLDSEGEYEVDDVFFHHKQGNTEDVQNVTLSMMSLAIYGNNMLFDWVDELLPDALRADTFMEDADKSYSDMHVAMFSGIVDKKTAA